MKLTLTNIDALAKDLQEITSPKIFEGGRVAKNGLFSMAIFGPQKSYHCGCIRSSYHGPNSGKETCPICGVDITTAEERRKRYGKIELPFPILNPIFYYLMTSYKLSSKLILNNLLTHRFKYYYDENDVLVKITANHVIDPNTIHILEGLDGAVEYITKVISSSPKKAFEYMRNNIDKIKVNNIIVIPPNFRSCTKIPAGSYLADNINQLYIFILIRSNHVKKIPYDITNDDVYKTNFKQIQMSVIDLYDYILGRLSKKKGLIRGNILGKRLDFSGRAVISPDPSLKLNECRLPYFMILEALKPNLAAYLINRKVCSRLNKAVEIIEDCIKDGDTKLFNLVEDFCHNKICILNRQPTLHRLSILAFNFKAHLGNTIQIHPLVVHGYNADFDGDSADCEIEITKSELSPHSGQTVKLEDVLYNFNFQEISRTTKENNIEVIKYKPLEELTTKSICVNTGVIENKKILEFSKHTNLEMFKISDSNNRFKNFWVSSDHSIIVYDEKDQLIKSITPKELLEHPEGKYLIKNNTVK